MPAHWASLEKLFGPRGACGGCWCMTWRLRKADYQRLKGEGNRKAFRKLLSKHEPLGVIAFSGNEPIGWCSVSPREQFVRLESSRALKPIDDQKVWVISCLYISRPWRRKGLSVKLVNAAVRFASEKQAKIVEAYPVVPKNSRLPDVFAWTGIASTFEAAGFTEAKRNTPSRPIMRYYL